MGSGFGTDTISLQLRRLQLLRFMLAEWYSKGGHNSLVYPLRYSRSHFCLGVKLRM